MSGGHLQRGLRAQGEVSLREAVRGGETHVSHCLLRVRPHIHRHSQLRRLPVHVEEAHVASGVVLGLHRRFAQVSSVKGLLRKDRLGGEIQTIERVSDANDVVLTLRVFKDDTFSIIGTADVEEQELLIFSEVLRSAYDLMAILQVAPWEVE